MSVLYRQPLHEVAQWPAADIRLLQAYLHKQPAPEERIDVSLAKLRRTIAIYLDKGKDHPLEEFLPYQNPWPKPEADVSEVDASIRAL